MAMGAVLGGIMIDEFVAAWHEKKPLLRERFKTSMPGRYQSLVQDVVEVVLADEDKYRSRPDPARIHEINDGDYQGTLVYVTGSTGYQPDTYWTVKVSYGSCSGCDTIAMITSMGDYDANEATEEQLKHYMTLALHIIQGLKEI
jgi:hypothetical protein